MMLCDFVCKIEMVLMILYFSVSFCFFVHFVFLPMFFLSLSLYFYCVKWLKKKIKLIIIIIIIINIIYKIGSESFK